LATEQTQEHFHVEVRVQNEGEFGAFENIPNGRDVYKNQYDAETVAWSFMDLQRDIFASYMHDHHKGQSAGYLSSMRSEELAPNEVLKVTYANPLNGDLMECVVTRCDGQLIQAGEMVGNDLIAKLLTDIFGDGPGGPQGSVTIISVDADGTAEVLADAGGSYTINNTGQFSGNIGGGLNKVA
jgi:hypothetical protein